MSDESAVELQLASTNRRIDHLIATLEYNDIPFTAAPRINQPPTGDPHLMAFFTKHDDFLRLIDSNHSADDLAIVAWNITVEASPGLRTVEGTLTFSSSLPLQPCWCWTSKGKTVFGSIEEGDKVQLTSGANKFVATVSKVHLERCQVEITGRTGILNEPGELVQVKGTTFSKGDKLQDLNGNRIDYELLGNDLLFIGYPAQYVYPGRCELVKVTENNLGQPVSRSLAVFVSRMHMTERQIEIVANVPRGG